MIYKFSGPVTFMNVYQHEVNIQNVADKIDYIIFDFNFVFFVDLHAVQEIKRFIKKFEAG